MTAAAAAEARGRRVADDPPHLRRVGLQPARSDHRRQRRTPAAGVGLLDRRRERPRGAAPRPRRRDVRLDARQPGDCRRREDGPASLALSTAAARGRRRHAPDHARRRALRRQGVSPGERGRARRARRPDGQGSVDRRRRRQPERLLHDAGAAGGGRPGDDRRLGRRVRHSRIRGGVRRRDRQASVEDLHGAGAGRARQRDVAQGRAVEDRWRAGLGDRQLRSGDANRLLGHRQRRTVDGRPAPGRQPLHRVDDRAGREDRRRSAATSSTTRTIRGTGTRCRRRSSWTTSARAAR